MKRSDRWQQANRIRRLFEANDDFRVEDSFRDDPHAPARPPRREVLVPIDKILRAFRVQTEQHRKVSLRGSPGAASANLASSLVQALIQVRNDCRDLRAIIRRLQAEQEDKK